MRSHNPTTPRRSSLGALRALAFIPPPRLLRILCVLAPPLQFDAPQTPPTRAEQ
jgi:hypothetical protein